VKAVAIARRICNSFNSVLDRVVNYFIMAGLMSGSFWGLWADLGAAFSSVSALAATVNIHFRTAATQYMYLLLLPHLFSPAW